MMMVKNFVATAAGGAVFGVDFVVEVAASAELAGQTDFEGETGGEAVEVAVFAVAAAVQITSTPLASPMCFDQLSYYSSTCNHQGRCVLSKHILQELLPAILQEEPEQQMWKEAHLPLLR